MTSDGAVPYSEAIVIYAQINRVDRITSCDIHSQIASTFVALVISFGHGIVSKGACETARNILENKSSN